MFDLMVENDRLKRIPQSSRNDFTNNVNGVGKPCGCKATVLLVDDVPFNLIPLRTILESEYKIDVNEAMDG